MSSLWYNIYYMTINSERFHTCLCSFVFFRLFFIVHFIYQKSESHLANGATERHNLYAHFVQYMYGIQRGKRITLIPVQGTGYIILEA